jgi:FkbM family methyltransferase
VKIAKPEERLKDLFAEDIQDARIRAETAYDVATGELANSIIIHGAGRFGRMVNRKLNSLGIRPLAFVDNNPSLWGKKIDGSEVLEPKEAASTHGKQAVFLVCVWNGEAHDRMADRVGQLKSLGCEVVIPFGFLFWKYHQTFLPHYCLDLPEKVLTQKNLIHAAMQLWDDQYSREEFVAQVEFRTSLDFDLIDWTVDGKHYFPPGLFSLTENEVFVDCGAFDGDTVADFIQQTRGRFQQVIAFEPDTVTYPRLEERISELDGDLRQRIRLNQQAIGRMPGMICFDSTGTVLSKTGSGSGEVQVVDLDSALTSVNPTYIKFDIEGFEPEALMGASHLLSRTRPILALSVYHQQDHLWKIPLLLSSMVPERYEFFLRPHGTESWDLVCYAVPVERTTTYRAQ